MAAAISKSVVRITNEYTGRDTTDAHTTIADNLVVVVTSDALLKGERRLVAQGEAKTVLALRKRFQDAMGEDLIAAVEEHTARGVAALMSDNHTDPDLGVEVFALVPSG